MRAFMASAVVAFLAATASCQEVAVKGEAPAVANDTQPFTGVWVPQSSVVNGKEQLPDKASRDMIRLSIEHGEYKLYYLTDPVKLEGRRLAVADFTIDEKAGTFELKFKEGIKKDTKIHGIYELGKSTLKLCYCPSDKPRPTKFEAPAGSDAFCDLYELNKKK